MPDGQNNLKITITFEILRYLLKSRRQTAILYYVNNFRILCFSADYTDGWFVLFDY